VQIRRANMLVRDIMTSNLITVSSDTLMVEAGKTMEFHRIERLPVVDKGKLVGILTKSILDKAAPTRATSLTRWELNYLLGKMTVKEIMRRDVVTISGDSTVECAIATAQTAKVGSLPVVDEHGRVVGIVTTNDFFYKILNPLMGIGQSGSRISVYGAGDAGQIEQVMGCLGKLHVGLKAICTVAPAHGGKNDLLLHLDTDDPTRVMAELKKLGFTVDTREHKPCSTDPSKPC
ncbi:MAG: CBS domain-containing protein, partial [Chloroflexi bacterium]|nr:CBS domain-containing protein [Chloroflexota bacterium]